MANETNDEGSKIEASPPQRNSYDNIPLKKIAEYLQKRIRNYKCGGIRGVYKAIDECFKPIGGKTSGDTKTITLDAFEGQVKRLQNITENMTFGLKGNILLLFNIFEILGINKISDLTGVSFKEPNWKEYIIDTNVKSERIIEELDKLSESLRIAMERARNIFCVKRKIS